MPKKPCPFCVINPRKNWILAEGREVVVFLSNPRLMRGHTIIIPRRHVATLAELTESERNELFATGIRFQEKIKAALSELWGVRVGCDFSQHDRSFMTPSRVSVPGHLHLHLRPRTKEDELYLRVQTYETPMFKHPPTREKRKFQALLAE